MNRISIGILLATIFLGMTGCASGPKPMRVMTYNIHHGEGIDGKIDLKRIAQLITENKVDLVALQEVDRNAERTGKLDMPAELARLTGLKAAFGANIPLEGGEYGNLILSRYPFEVLTNYHLPKVVPGEQRGMLEVLVKSPGGPLKFYVTHLDHRREEADRLASVDLILKTIDPTGRMILAGDFNARPESETYRRLRARFVDSWTVVGSGDGFTIPAEAPRARIDYVFCAGFKPKTAVVLKSDASDHLPVMVDLE